MLEIVSYGHSKCFNEDYDFVEQRFKDALIVNRYVDTTDLDLMNKKASRLWQRSSENIRHDIYDFVSNHIKEIKEIDILIRKIAVVEYCNKNGKRVEFFIEKDIDTSSINDLCQLIKNELSTEKLEYYTREFFDNGNAVKIIIDNNEVLINFRKIDSQIILQDELSELTDDKYSDIFVKAINHFFSENRSNGSLSGDFDGDNSSENTKDIQNNEVWIRSLCSWGYTIKFLNSLTP